MAIKWHAEACDLAPDPCSGARITRLTSSVMSNVNLYFEQPYGSPDGRRIAYARSTTADPRLPPTELCAADLQTLRITPLDADIVSTWFATSSWSGKVHYLRRNGELIRVDLTSLNKEIVMTHWPLEGPVTLWTVSPNLRYLIVGQRRENDNFLYRIDLKSQELTLFYRGDDILNHVQINHVDGRQVLVQRNIRGKGATHAILDLMTGKETPLRIGEPYTGSSTGHASWVGATGRIVTPVQWPGMSVAFSGTANRPSHDNRHPQGNLIVVGPGEDPITFEAPEHLFNHSSASRCGHYFVAESLRHGIPGAVEIVVGDLESGKYRTLVSDCGSQGGGPACSHVHAWFTADNRHVIYNADPWGISHVHKAELPEDFLLSLR